MQLESENDGRHWSVSNHRFSGESSKSRPVVLHDTNIPTQTSMGCSRAGGTSSCTVGWLLLQSHAHHPVQFLYLPYCVLCIIVAISDKSCSRANMT